MAEAGPGTALSRRKSIIPLRTRWPARGGVWLAAKPSGNASCGEEVPEPRRLAMPGVTRCTLCQSEREAGH
jgi:hypothetical protein